MSFPLLHAVEPARLASAERPAASAVYVTAAAKDGVPPLPGVETLYDVFRCAWGAGASREGGGECGGCVCVLVRPLLAACSPSAHAPATAAPRNQSQDERDQVCQRPVPGLPAQD